MVRTVTVPSSQLCREDLMVAWSVFHSVTARPVHEVKEAVGGEVNPVATIVVNNNNNNMWLTNGGDQVIYLGSSVAPLTGTERNTSLPLAHRKTDL